MIKVVVFVISRLFILLLPVFSTIPFIHNSVSYDVYVRGLVEKVANMNVIHDVDSFKIFFLFVFLITRFTVDSAEHNNLLNYYLL
jgi:hypothetical protein